MKLKFLFLSVQFRWNKYANLGDEISEIIKLLANHQDPGEPIVCPREIEVLSGRIKGLEN